MNKKARGQAEFQRWMGPLLDCLRALGGAAKPAEVSRWIAEHLKLGPETTETSLKSGANRFHNQVQWARQYLVWEGLIDDAKRGTWKLTPLGWKTRLDEAEARTIFLDRVRLQQSERARGTDTNRDDGPGLSNPQQLIDSAPPPDEQPEEDLLKVLKSLSAGGFERLCKRLLHEHGFENVSVTQQSRDGGIDGYGTLRLSAFVSMKVAFQAKRYKDVVSRPAVGEFRNALLGRAEKGVFITTGRFSADAEAEASREGVIPIELIDGERLVELFEEKGLGVKPKQIVTIDHAFFDEFRK